MRPMAARGEVRVVVSFGLTSSPALSHAVSYAIEHASATEELRSGMWEATFRIGSDERTYGELRHLLRLVGAWKTTRVEVDGSVEPRKTVEAMLGCASGWLRTDGRCAAWFPSARGARRCRVCPLYDAAVGGHSPKDPLSAAIVLRVDGHRGGVDRDRREAEPLGRRCHLKGLVRPLGVVVGDPGIEFDLGPFERGEAPIGEELLTQGLVEALRRKLGSRSRRPRL